jgi:hypothetical protein
MGAWGSGAIAQEGFPRRLGPLKRSVDRNSGVEHLILPENLLDLARQRPADEGTPVHLVDQQAQEAQILIVMGLDLLNQADRLDQPFHTEGAP